MLKIYMLTRGLHAACTLLLEFSKNGDFELLRFPHFRREMLSQQRWSPGDDIGRIKVILSEGFSPDPLIMPPERVKNIVAFSFQHAPLGWLIRRLSVSFRHCN